MSSKANKYRLTLEQVSLAKEDTELRPPIQFEFTNHDEIFSIIEVVREKNPFGDTNQSTEFAVGLKLLTEVVLKNRTHPFFEEFFPAVGVLMKKIKNS